MVSSRLNGKRKREAGRESIAKKLRLLNGLELPPVRIGSISSASPDSSLPSVASSLSSPVEPSALVPPPFGLVYSSGEMETSSTGIVNLANIQPPISSDLELSEGTAISATLSTHQTPSAEQLTRPEWSLAMNRGKEVMKTVKGSEEIIRLSKLRDPPDVEMRLVDRVYHLHSFMLRCSSKWFEASMSEHWGNAVEGRSDNIKFVYVLRVDEDGSPSLIPPHKLTEPNQLFSKETATCVESYKATLDSYDTLLRCIYRTYDPRKSLQSMEQLENLLYLADEYDCTLTVSPILEASFWSRPDPYTEIARIPLRSFLFALQIHSANIFRSAFVHLVGKWDLTVPLSENSHPDLNLPDPIDPITLHHLGKNCPWNRIFRAVLPPNIFFHLVTHAQVLAARQKRTLSSLIALKFGVQKHEMVSRIIRDRLRTHFQNHMYGCVMGQERRLYKAVAEEPFEPTEEEEKEHKKRWEKGDKSVDLRKAMEGSVGIVKKMAQWYLKNESGLRDDSELLEESWFGYLLCEAWDKPKMPWDE